MPTTSRFSCRALATTHSYPVSSRSSVGSGLPAPGRSSKSPRAEPLEIWGSTQVSNDIPGGLRSVIAIHRDTGLPGSGHADDEQPRGLPEPLDAGARGRRSSSPTARPASTASSSGPTSRWSFPRRTAGSGWSSSTATRSAGARGSSRRAPGAHGSDGTPEELARAELAEETGLRAGRLEHLGRLDLASGPDRPSGSTSGWPPT